MNRNATATILLAIALGIYFTFTQEVINDAKLVKSINDRYGSAIKNAEKLIEVRDRVRKADNEISDIDRARLDKMVPNTVDNIRLLIDLNSVAVRHGFVLKNIRAETSESGEKKAPASAQGSSASASSVISTPVLDTVKVSFDLEAPYFEFISFLQDLEANLRIMDVSQLSVSPSDGSMYNFRVELKTYWLRQ